MTYGRRFKPRPKNGKLGKPFRFRKQKNQKNHLNAIGVEESYHEIGGKTARGKGYRKKRNANARFGQSESTENEISAS